VPWSPAHRTGTRTFTFQRASSQVHFTIEDAGAFTTPWTATMIYLRDRGRFPEEVCAENRFAFHHNQEADLPHADKPDF
jgi:hypothetical protein